MTRDRVSWSGLSVCLSVICTITESTDNCGDNATTFGFFVIVLSSHISLQVRPGFPYDSFRVVDSITHDLVRFRLAGYFLHRLLQF